MSDDRAPRGNSRMQNQLDAVVKNQGVMITDLALLKHDHSSLRSDVQVKHSENRRSIHDLRGLIQRLIDDIWKIKLQNARWNIGAGVVTAVLVKLVEKYWH